MEVSSTMQKATITLNISPDVAARAREAGLLTNEGLEKLILAELMRQETAQQFIEDIKLISATDPIITPTEIEAEIAAHRAENPDE